MRRPFQSIPGKPLTKPVVSPLADAQADEMLAVGIENVRNRIANRFADAGFELTDADVVSVIAGISAAIAVAEDTAVAAVLDMKKRGAGK